MHCSLNDLRVSLSASIAKDCNCRGTSLQFFALTINVLVSSNGRTVLDENPGQV